MDAETDVGLTGASPGVRSDRPHGDRRRLVLAVGAASLGALATGCATTPPAPATLRVKVFPGAQNLAIFAALEQGHFERERLTIDLQYTRNSVELRDDLASGAVDIAHAAVDNAVAMRDVAGRDIVVFMGGDDGLNELFVQPGITAVEQLRGKTLIVDAPDTAYALQARKILLDHGLRAGDYRVEVVGGTFQRVQAMIDDPNRSVSTLNPPFSLQARDAGLRSLGHVTDFIGRYQASSAFAMRPWAQAHGDRLVRYVAAYVGALRWALDPANRVAATELLGTRLKLPPAAAARTYAALTDPKHGLTPDARFDPAGFETTLAMRAALEGARSPAPGPADRYVDLGWYRTALRRLPAGGT